MEQISATGSSINNHYVGSTTSTNKMQPIENKTEAIAQQTLGHPTSRTSSIVLRIVEPPITVSQFALIYLSEYPEEIQLQIFQRIEAEFQKQKITVNGDSPLATLDHVKIALAALTELDLSCLSLTTSPDRLLAACNNLKQLSLSHNRIVSFPKLQNNICISVLLLNNNKISDINDDVQFKKLFFLDLSENQIRTVPKNIGIPIHWLDLHGNRIEKMDWCEKIHSLFYLNLSENLISEIPENFTLKKCFAIDLSYNKIKNIPKLTLPFIFSLNFSNNVISSISKDLYLETIKILNLKNNLLENFSLNNNLPNIDNIDIRFNKINDILSVQSLFKDKKVFLHSYSKEENISNHIYTDLLQSKIDDVSNLSNSRRKLYFYVTKIYLQKMQSESLHFVDKFIELIDTIDEFSDDLVKTLQTDNCDLGFVLRKIPFISKKELKDIINKTNKILNGNQKFIDGQDYNEQCQSVCTSINYFSSKITSFTSNLLCSNEENTKNREDLRNTRKTKEFEMHERSVYIYQVDKENKSDLALNCSKLNNNLFHDQLMRYESQNEFLFEELKRLYGELSDNSIKEEMLIKIRKNCVELSYSDDDVNNSVKKLNSNEDFISLYIRIQEYVKDNLQSNKKIKFLCDQFIDFLKNRNTKFMVVTFFEEVEKNTKSTIDFLEILKNRLNKDTENQNRNKLIEMIANCENELAIHYDIMQLKSYELDIQNFSSACCRKEHCGKKMIKSIDKCLTRLAVIDRFDFHYRISYKLFHSTFWNTLIRLYSDLLEQKEVDEHCRIKMGQKLIEEEELLKHIRMQTQLAKKFSKTISSLPSDTTTPSNGSNNGSVDSSRLAGNELLAKTARVPSPSPIDQPIFQENIGSSIQLFSPQQLILSDANFHRILALESYSLLRQLPSHGQLLRPLLAFHIGLFWEIQLTYRLLQKTSDISLKHDLHYLAKANSMTLKPEIERLFNRSHEIYRYPFEERHQERWQLWRGNWVDGIEGMIEEVHWVVRDETILPFTPSPSEELKIPQLEGIASPLAQTFSKQAAHHWNCSNSFHDLQKNLPLSYTPLLLITQLYHLQYTLENILKALCSLEGMQTKSHNLLFLAQSLNQYRPSLALATMLNLGKGSESPFWHSYYAKNYNQPAIKELTLLSKLVDHTQRSGEGFIPAGLTKERGQAILSKWQQQQEDLRRLLISFFNELRSTPSLIRH